MEFLLSGDLNHAFAIHHWGMPQWQSAAAKLALRAWRPEWWRQPPVSPSASLPVSTAAASLPVSAAAAALPVAALLPALMQPLLASKVGGGEAGSEALSTSAAEQRRRLAGLGMYADALDTLPHDLRTGQILGSAPARHA